LIEEKKRQQIDKSSGISRKINLGIMDTKRLFKFTRKGNSMAEYYLRIQMAFRMRVMADKFKSKLYGARACRDILLNGGLEIALTGDWGKTPNFLDLPAHKHEHVTGTNQPQISTRIQGVPTPNRTNRSLSSPNFSINPVRLQKVQRGLIKKRGWSPTHQYLTALHCLHRNVVGLKQTTQTPAVAAGGGGCASATSSCCCGGGGATG
jgi:hypothetical protein